MSQVLRKAGPWGAEGYRHSFTIQQTFTGAIVCDRVTCGSAAVPFTKCTASQEDGYQFPSFCVCMRASVHVSAVSVLKSISDRMDLK